MTSGKQNPKHANIVFEHAILEPELQPPPAFDETNWQP